MSDYTENDNIPQVDLTIESVPVTAKRRKLRARWTVEPAMDLEVVCGITGTMEFFSIVEIKGKTFINDKYKDLYRENRWYDDLQVVRLKCQLKKKY